MHRQRSSVRIYHKVTCMTSDKYGSFLLVFGIYCDAIMTVFFFGFVFTLQLIYPTPEIGPSSNLASLSLAPILYPPDNYCRVYYCGGTCRENNGKSVEIVMLGVRSKVASLY